MSSRGVAAAAVSPAARRSPRLARRGAAPATPAIARGSRTKASSSVSPVADLAVRVSTTSADVPFERISIEAAVPSTASKDAAAFDEVFVIPGNPGVPGYYERFAKTIWCHLEGRSKVSVIGYVGHTASDLGVTRWFSLAEQVEHVTAEIVKGRGGSKIAVVGHSIGAEIAMRAMAKHPNAIQKVVGLMPFVLTNERSKLQRFLASLVRVKPLVLLVASLVGFFKKVFPFFLNPATRGMDPDAKRLTKSWLRAGSVINMALMGRTEFDGLKDPRNDCDAANLETYAERVHLLYCEDDHWAPTWQAEAFKGMYAEADVAVEPSSQEVKVEHAFVLSDAAADLVALRTAGMLLRG